jgi:CheY-like chemotaxis protein
MRAAGRVLVIDDEPAVLAAVGDLLRDEGYVVDGATTAGAALDLLWQDWEQQPDAILLDWHLPALDGQTFADLYRLLPVPAAPLILLSGDTTIDAQAPAVGAAAVLHKPFTLEALLACVHRTIQATA